MLPASRTITLRQTSKTIRTAVEKTNAVVQARRGVQFPDGFERTINPHQLPGLADDLRKRTGRTTRGARGASATIPTGQSTPGRSIKLSWKTPCLPTSTSDYYSRGNSQRPPFVMSEQGTVQGETESEPVGSRTNTVDVELQVG